MWFVRWVGNMLAVICSLYLLHYCEILICVVTAENRVSTTPPPLPIHPMCVIKGGSKLCRSISLLRKLKLETNQPVWSAWYIKSNRELVKRLLPSFGINLVISTRVYQAFTEDESTSQVLSNHFVAKHHVNEVKNLQFPSYAILIKRNIATHS